MSAGAFVKSKYEADNGNIHPIRLQPETLLGDFGAVNEAPAGAVTIGLFATARGSKRRYGVNARTVRVRFGATPPAGYLPNAVVSVPILTPTLYALIDDTVTGMTYLSSPVTYVGKTAESVR